jgi:hypothetical protein
MAGNLSLGNSKEPRSIHEGESDFLIIRRFARCLGLQQLASSADITPVESGGFSAWERIKALAWGFTRTLGRNLILGAVFDRDFWCDEELREILQELVSTLQFAHIHQRKEIENYLLVPTAIDRALRHAADDRGRRGGRLKEELEPATTMLERLTDPRKTDLQGQYVARRIQFLKNTKRDAASIATETIRGFEAQWGTIDTRMALVDGKEVLRALRGEVQQRWKLTISDAVIIEQFREEEVPEDLRKLLLSLEEFRQLHDRT